MLHADWGFIIPHIYFVLSFQIQFWPWQISRLDNNVLAQVHYLSTLPFGNWVRTSNWSLNFMVSCE
jgi:hypothetical protein